MLGVCLQGAKSLATPLPPDKQILFACCFLTQGSGGGQDGGAVLRPITG